MWNVPQRQRKEKKATHQKERSVSKASQETYIKLLKKKKILKVFILKDETFKTDL